MIQDTHHNSNFQVHHSTHLNILLSQLKLIVVMIPLGITIAFKIVHGRQITRIRIKQIQILLKVMVRWLLDLEVLTIEISSTHMIFHSRKIHKFRI
jgi:hypothetical protein